MAFEDGVIGMNVGDEKDLNLKFPDNYGSADLAGQGSRIPCEIKPVKI